MATKKLKKFLIILDNESLLYFPGSFLSGKILLEIEEETPILGKIKDLHEYHHVLICLSFLQVSFFILLVKVLFILATKEDSFILTKRITLTFE